ncbi:NADPH-dependent FMN reductase, partial [Streptomyces tsukubensis]|uniref:NADPH-dependent FMN reductase n=1 Tax=Streptomyces tsukubensis TaxID=83656 RepID=UPI00307B401B
MRRPRDHVSRLSCYDEWQTKPVAFMSYGHGSCGLHAVEHLRSVFTGLHTV